MSPYAATAVVVLLLAVVICAYWEPLKGWAARLSDKAERVDLGPWFGDWSDAAKPRPYDWHKELRALGRPVPAKALQAAPANRERRIA